MERRARFRQGLTSLYLPFYDRLCAALPPEWQPLCGFRSVEDQDVLYRQGRTSPGRIVTNATGGKSAHNYGCATDWMILQGTVPRWPPSTDPCWAFFGEAVKQAGLTWGGDWNGNAVRDPNDCDLGHAELKITCGWEHVYYALKQTNMRGAMEHIEKNMVKWPESGQAGFKQGDFMTEVVGTKELTDVVDLGVAAVNVAIRAEADGSIDISDLYLVLQLIPNIGPALDGISLVPAELKDLSAAEADVLVAHVMSELSVVDPKAREIIDAALALAKDAFRLKKALTS